MHENAAVETFDVHVTGDTSGDEDESEGGVLGNDVLGKGFEKGYDVFVGRVGDVDVVQDEDGGRVSFCEVVVGETVNKALNDVMTRGERFLGDVDEEIVVAPGGEQGGEQGGEGAVEPEVCADASQGDIVDVGMLGGESWRWQEQRRLKRGSLAHAAGAEEEEGVGCGRGAELGS